MQDYENEDKDSWSPLYYALEGILKLLTKEETIKPLVEVFKSIN